MASSESALLEEIRRLSGAINQRKTVQPPPPAFPASSGRGRGRPPHSQPSYRPTKASFTDYTPNQRPGAISSNAPPAKEVIIDGVAFQSNGKTLVRRPASTSTSTPANQSAASSTTQSPASRSPNTSISPQIPTTGLPTATNPGGKPLIRTRNGLIAADRYKSPTVNPNPKAPIKPPRGVAPRAHFTSTVTGYSKRANPGRNLTLNKSGSQPRTKSKKYEKQCKHFTRTGVCGRGGTCPYQHDSQKIALCPLFLAEKCPFKDRPELCSLSHDPIPERTPICTRFSATGDCYKGADCFYPHIRVGPKKGICRDFAVLGFCDKGAMCEAAHLRECPDFAETGVCKKMGIKGPTGCKLPHVIRANNQQRIGIAKAPKADSALQQSPPTTTTPALTSNMDPAQKRKIGDIEDTVVPDEKKRKLSSSSAGSTERATAEDSNDFISLTFLESDDGEDEDDSDDEDDDEEEEEEEDAVLQPDTERPMSESFDAGDDEADEAEVVGGLVAGDDIDMDGASPGW
ncbi:hypothetical protein FRB95_001953 [Tulasnella sp. JGI-2019a]|nr:hypothetical protein FRB95_001953 [Tulasnella sp. JGI-2019a]